MKEGQELVEYYQKKIDEMWEEIHKINMRTIDTLNLAKAGAGINPETDEKDEAAMDEILNADIEALTITKGIVSKVYRGRLISVKQLGDKSIHINFSNHNTHRQDKDYKGTQMNLSVESFILIMEAMEFASKKFNLDRKSIIKSLTGGDSIDFKDSITTF